MDKKNKTYKVPNCQALILIRKDAKENEEYSLEQKVMAAYIDGYLEASSMLSRTRLELNRKKLFGDCNAIAKSLQKLTEQYDNEYDNMVDLLNDLSFKKGLSRKCFR